MHQSLARYSAPVSLVHAPSWADFITTMVGFKVFGTHNGELKSGRNGKGGKVKSRRQAIAIALEEAGASRYESDSRNRRNLRRTEKKEAQGRTGQQEREGKSHVGAYRKRESTRAMAGRDTRKTTARGRKTAP